MREKIKYLLLTIAAILLIFCLNPMETYAAEIEASGTTGADWTNLTWTRDTDGVVTISGTGAMANHRWGCPWDNSAETYSSPITKVIIEEGVTTIGDYAFLNSSDLISVEIADSVTTIGVSAFQNCPNLTEIQFSDGITEIQSNAFCDCINLQQVIITENIEQIGDYAFAWCDALETVFFMDDVESISTNSFYGSGAGNLKLYGLAEGSLKSYAEDAEIDFVLIEDMRVLNFYLDTDLSESSATLTWDGVSLSDGYRLYQLNTSSQKYELVKTLAPEATSCKLTGLSSGTTYTYKICSFVEIGGKEYLSKEAEIVFRTEDAGSVISAKNALVSNGYSGTLTNVTQTFNAVYAWTVANYGKYAAAVSDISQFTDASGNYCIAYLNKAGTYVYIRAYNKNMKQVYYRTIKPVYPLLGGVACDEDGNFYIVWGKTDPAGGSSCNTTSSASIATMAISKYTKSGTLVKTKKFKMDYSGGTKEPFRSGNCDIAIEDGILICNYSRGMYSGHQSNDLITIDIETMEEQNDYYNYVSHSFDQRVLFDKDGVAWFVNHGDAYPRAFGVSTYGSGIKAADYEPFHFYALESALDNMSVLNVTNARLGGVVETSSGLVLVGSSVKSMKKSGYNSQTKNLFIMYADPDKTMNGSTSRSGTCLGESVTDTGVKWLTSYTSYDAECPQVVYTNDDRIVVLWETSKDGVYKNTYYMILSSNGTVLQKATKIINARLNANEEPIYKDGYIYWTTCGDDYSECNTLSHHRLDISTVSFDKTVLAVSGLKSTTVGSKITLNWTKNSVADGYLVYKYNGSSYKQIKKVTSNSYSFSGLKLNTQYKFAVKSYKVIDGTTYYGSMSYLKTRTGPAKVQSFKVSTKTKNTVSLKWNKVSGATGYYIYRYNTSTGKYTKIAAVKASTLKYTVKSLKAGTNYTFAIKAYKTVNSVKYWSAYSTVKVKTK